MLRVIEYFAYSHSSRNDILCRARVSPCLYTIVMIAASRIPFLRYLAPNNGVTSKSGLEILKVSENGTFRTPWYSFLFAFHGRILYHFRDKMKYWSKIAIFSYPLHSTPSIRVSPSERCHNIGV